MASAGTIKGCPGGESGMAENAKSAVLPRFFDKNPELKTKALAYLATLSEEEKRRNLELMEKFISGEMSWAEIKNIPQRLLKYFARAGYMSFKAGDFAKAETIFKGLAVMDHLNWYYRSALGAVFQKQNLLRQAIEEYTAALELKPDEITSLVNRGQCHFLRRDKATAKADFERVLQVSDDENNLWVRRAQVLLKAVETPAE